MAVALHAAPDDGAVEHAECGEQGRSAVRLVVGRDGLAASGLDRQAGLGAVERMDLAFFIDRQHHVWARGSDGRRDQYLAGLTGLVTQQTLDPALGEALLPSPHGQPADADALRHPLRRGEYDARPLDLLARVIAVGDDRCQLLAFRGAQHHKYPLCRGPASPLKHSLISAHSDSDMNLLNESEH